MSNFITLSAIGADMPDFSALPKNFSVYEKEMMANLKKNIDDVLPDRPDLIVLPECANRYVPFTRPELKEYYTFLGNRMVEYMQEIAVNNNTNIAYSAYRIADPDDEHPFRNSTIYIGRTGEICGIYDKNHLVIEEYTQNGAQYGTEAKVIPMDFGKVASTICFDLNFDELLYQYPSQSPDLIVFCSMFHGGQMRQAQWAYACRSYFIGAVCGHPCYVLNPFGEIIASSTNYTKYVSTKVNLDFAICHWDYNREKFNMAKNKYRDKLSIYDPGFVGSVMLSYEGNDKKVHDILSEFEIETLDVYLQRVRTHRKESI